MEQTQGFHFQYPAPLQQPLTLLLHTFCLSLQAQCCWNFDFHVGFPGHQPKACFFSVSWQCHLKTQKQTLLLCLQTQHEVPQPELCCCCLKQSKLQLPSPSCISCADSTRHLFLSGEEEGVTWRHTGGRFVEEEGAIFTKSLHIARHGTFTRAARCLGSICWHGPVQDRAASEHWLGNNCRPRDANKICSWSSLE